MSRRVPHDDGWGEFIQDAAYRIGGMVREFVPPEAQLHLLNAQRELLQAMMLIYEHQAQARRQPPRRSGVGSRKASAPRLRRIDIDPDDS